MNIKPLGANTFEVDTKDYTILYSYQTPVAIYNKSICKFQRTSSYHSRTTTKHINKWLDGAKAIEISQETLDQLAREI